MQAFMAAADSDAINPLISAKKALQDTYQHALQSREKMQQKIKKLSAVANRISRTVDGENVLRQMVEQKIQGIQNQLDALNDEMPLVQRAIALCDEFKYDEPVPGDVHFGRVAPQGSGNGFVDALQRQRAQNPWNVIR